eukprot:869356-Prorocentrum_minimum.AAC.1
MKQESLDNITKRLLRGTTPWYNSSSYFAGPPVQVPARVHTTPQGPVPFSYPASSSPPRYPTSLSSGPAKLVTEPKESTFDALRCVQHVYQPT